MEMKLTPRQTSWCRVRLGVPAMWLTCVLLSGCAAVTNPLADGIPVNRLPPEVLGRPRADEKTIPLVLLRQKPPDVYRLAPGDTLGVYIDNVGLGQKDTPPPVHYPTENGGNGALPPSLGYPIPVREDGTVPLPLIDPLNVDGLTVIEAQNKIINAYTVSKKILVKDAARIIVTLQRPRQSHILVVRQDTGTLGAGTIGGSLPSQIKRGTGLVLDLPAYENDVLNALARSGGLPGLDAMNEVIIQRGAFKEGMQEGDLQSLMNKPGNAYPGVQQVRIPLRLRPGEPLPFRAEDVILNTGDIVFIEARDTEVFYVGGLLTPKQFVLPRDYDLDVVQAVALAGGPLLNNQSLNSLSGSLTQSGIGFPSPSLVIVVRKTADGGQIPIRVSLNRAVREPRERILIQANDTIYLQLTPVEAFAQYFTNVFKYNFFGTIISQQDLIGTTTLSGP